MWFIIGLAAGICAGIWYKNNFTSKEEFIKKVKELFKKLDNK